MNEDIARTTGVLREQAEWLFQFHEERSNSAVQRALGVVAFAGALLAFTPGVLGTHASMWAKILLSLGAISLVVALSFAVAALRVEAVIAPSIEQLQQNWSDHLTPDGTRRLDRELDAPNALIGHKGEVSPLQDAKNVADRRFARLGYSYASLLIGLLFVASAAVSQIVFAWGGK